MTQTEFRVSRPQQLITLIMVLVFISITALIGWVGLSEIEKNMRFRVRDVLQTVLHSNHEMLHIWINHRIHLLKLISQDESLSQLVQHQLSLPREKETLLAHQAALRDYFKPILATHGDLGMFVIAPDKIIIGSMFDDNIAKLNAISEKRPQLLDKVFQGETLFIPPIPSDVPLRDQMGRLVNNQPTLFFASPIITDSGEIIAVVVLRIDPMQDFSKITLLGQTGKTGETYAIDQSAVLLSESRFQPLLRHAGQLGPSGTTILSIRITEPRINLHQALQPSFVSEPQDLTYMAERATQGQSGVNIEGYPDYRGITVLGAWLWDEHLGIGLATEIDEEEALAPFYAIESIVLRILSVNAVLTAVLVLLLQLLSRKNNKNLNLLYQQLEQRVHQRTAELEEAKVMLSIANRELQELATTDSLTGLSNRRYLDEFFTNEWNRCMREQQAISVALFDIDYFKLYNDHYGHIAGDECLQTIGQLLKNERFLSRPGDLIARYGGEEFALVLSGTGQEDALYILNKVLVAIEQAQIPHVGTLVKNSQHVTISIGFASIIPKKHLKASSLMDAADQALYKAKSKGRNQLHIAELSALQMEESTTQKSTMDAALSPKSEST